MSNVNLVINISTDGSLIEIQALSKDDLQSAIDNKAINPAEAISVHTLPTNNLKDSQYLGKCIIVLGDDTSLSPDHWVVIGQ